MSRQLEPLLEVKTISSVAVSGKSLVELLLAALQGHHEFRLKSSTWRKNPVSSAKSGLWPKNVSGLGRKISVSVVTSAIYSQSRTQRQWTEFQRLTIAELSSGIFK